MRVALASARDHTFEVAADRSPLLDPLISILRQDRSIRGILDRNESRMRSEQGDDREPQAQLRALESGTWRPWPFKRESQNLIPTIDPDFGFYVKKVRRLVDDRGAATFVAEDDTGVVGGLTSASGRISSPRSPTRTSTAFSSVRRSAAPVRWESWWTLCSTIVDGRSSTASVPGPAPPTNR